MKKEKQGTSWNIHIMSKTALWRLETTRRWSWFIKENLKMLGNHLSNLRPDPKNRVAYKNKCLYWKWHCFFHRFKFLHKLTLINRCACFYDVTEDSFFGHTFLIFVSGMIDCLYKFLIQSKIKFNEIVNIYGNFAWPECYPYLYRFFRCSLYTFI